MDFKIANRIKSIFVAIEFIVQQNPNNINKNKDNLNFSYSCVWQPINLTWILPTRSMENKITNKIYLRQVANDFLGFLWENCIGYPLNVCPSGTASFIDSWNSSLPGVKPKTNITVITTYWWDDVNASKIG